MKETIRVLITGDKSDNISRLFVDIEKELFFASTKKEMNVQFCPPSELSERLLRFSPDYFVLVDENEDYFNSMKSIEKIRQQCAFALDQFSGKKIIMYRAGTGGDEKRFRSAGFVVIFLKEQHLQLGVYEIDEIVAYILESPIARWKFDNRA